jgi:hypothetical protein
MHKQSFIENQTKKQKQKMKIKTVLKFILYSQGYTSKVGF